MSFPQTRLRRLRQNPSVRNLVEETTLNPKQLIWPIFVVEGRGVKEPIPAMPGQFHYSVDQLSEVSAIVSQKQLGGVLLFGVPSQKEAKAGGATKKESLVAHAICELKSKQPNLLVATDVCLCAYMDHGHCGVVDAKGKVQNDASLELLGQMALRHAEAGADIVAPSDMMDGRVGVLRKTLDQNNFSDTVIMSYAAKYASSFYGPFRDAAHSPPQFGDRKSYQMNPANVREALREVELDIEEGADIVMVKPAMPYLDVIAAVRERFDVPIAAYQVSGEYSMIKAAAQNGWMDEAAAVQESLLAIRRAGAQIIITYFAPFLPS